MPEGPEPSERGPLRVTLYSSRRSWALAGFGGVLLIGGPIAVMSGRGFSWFSVAIAAIGLGLLGTQLYDHPVRTHFHHGGVTRVCPLRRDEIAWEQVVELTRAARDRIRRGDSLLGVDPQREARLRGGLAARTERGRVVLCDAVEGRFEYDAVRALLDRHAPDVPLAALRPPAKQSPTTLYRRSLRGRVDDR